MCDPPRDCRLPQQSRSAPATPMFLDLALRHAELLAEHKGWPPRKPCSRSTCCARAPAAAGSSWAHHLRPGRPAGIRPFPGRLPLQHFAARHPRRRDWVGSTARKHQANDAGGPAGHLFRTLKSRSGWCSPTPQPAPAGCSASARRPASATPRAVHTGPTPTGQIAEPQPVPARIGRQPQPRSPSELVNPPGPCAFDSFLCRPGKEGAPREGGRRGKEKAARSRRRHLTPVPRAASLAELNQMLAYADEVDEHRRIAARVETVGQAAAREVPLLNPLPGNAFRVAAALPCRVDAKARICLRQSYYSVPGSPAAGCRSRSALTGSTSGMTGFSSPGTPDQLHKGQREPGAGPTTWRCSSAPHPAPPGVPLAGATRPLVSRPGRNRRVHPRGHQRSSWDKPHARSRTCPAGGRGSMTGRYPRWTGTTTCCRPGHDGAGERFRYTLANFVSLSVAVVVGRGAS